MACVQAKGARRFRKIETVAKAHRGWRRGHETKPKKKAGNFFKFLIVFEKTTFGMIIMDENTFLERQW